MELTMIDDTKCRMKPVAQSATAATAKDKPTASPFEKSFFHCLRKRKSGDGGEGGRWGGGGRRQKIPK